MQQPERRFSTFHGFMAILSHIFPRFFLFSFSIQIVFLLKKRKKQPLFSFQTTSPSSSKASQNNNFFFLETERKRAIKDSSENVALIL